MSEISRAAVAAAIKDMTGEAFELGPLATSIQKATDRELSLGPASFNAGPSL